MKIFFFFGIFTCKGRSVFVCTFVWGVWFLEDGFFEVMEVFLGG